MKSSPLCACLTKSLCQGPSLEGGGDQVQSNCISIFLLGSSVPPLLLTLQVSLIDCMSSKLVNLTELGFVIYINRSNKSAYLTVSNEKIHIEWLAYGSHSELHIREQSFMVGQSTV